MHRSYCPVVSRLGSEPLDPKLLIRGLKVKNWVTLLV